MTNKKKTKKINLQPTAGHLIIEPQEKQQKTDSGIYLPDSAGDKPQKGTVLAVGADETTEKGVTRKKPANVGDSVIYKKWGGNEVKVDGRELLFARFDDILAVVK